jgi:hypothetical protein
MNLFVSDSSGNIKLEITSSRIAKAIFKSELGIWKKGNFKDKTDVDIFEVQNDHYMHFENKHLKVYFLKGDCLYVDTSDNLEPLNTDLLDFIRRNR